MAEQGMIGLEIHTYLVTKSKLFCNCVNSRKKGLVPNTNICPICTGQPGAKPMAPLEEAVFNAIQIGLMLGCKISYNMHWQRKHYDWPDLPKGYQITLSGSHAVPLGLKGKFGGIRIRSMHLEEDPAAWDPETGKVDYNRSGVPLVEIVTEPDFKNAEEVAAWLGALLHNLSYLGIVDSDAGIKVDVNVNIPGKSERTEIKNMNSVENIQKAIEYELRRHREEGQSTKETRRFDPKKGKTEKMREKEGAEDYRFIRDPDLPLLILEESFIESARKLLPETPEEKKASLMAAFKLSEKEADIIAMDRNVAEFYEQVASELSPAFAYTWVAGELLRLLNSNSCTLRETQIKPEHFIAVLKMVESGKITPLKGKEIVKQFYPRSFMPEAETQARITNKEELKRVAIEVIAENRKVADEYKAGKQESLNFLLGQMMRKTSKRADSQVARQALLEALG